MWPVAVLTKKGAAAEHGLVVGKRENPVDLRQHGMSCEVEEHGGASAHPLDHLVEDGKQRNSLTLVSSRSGNYGGWSTMAV
jgi:hypothetical protein